MSDIFISYASEDRPQAKRLAEALEAQGWSVWWDRTIPFGKRYHQVIEDELAAARSVMVVWSVHSVESDWVRAEAGEGLDRDCLLPVSMDDSRPPLVYRQIETADLSGWRGEPSEPVFRKLLVDLTDLLGAPPDPTVPPAPPENKENTIIIFGIPFTHGASVTLSAILLIVLVGVWVNFLGGVRDKQQREPPSLATPVASDPQQSMPQDPEAQRTVDVASSDAQRVPLTVTLYFTEQCWIEAQVDGGEEVSRLFVAGESLQLEAAERVVMKTIGNREGVRVMVNGVTLKPPISSGQTIRDWVIDWSDAVENTGGEPPT